MDLHVPERYREANLLGVPAGWRAYATRAGERRIAELEAEHMLAMHHADASEPSELVFLVCGGRDRVAGWCARRAAIHAPSGLFVHGE